LLLLCIIILLFTIVAVSTLVELKKKGTIEGRVSTRNKAAMEERTQIDGKAETDRQTHRERECTDQSAAHIAVFLVVFFSENIRFINLFVLKIVLFALERRRRKKERRGRECIMKNNKTGGRRRTLLTVREHHRRIARYRNDLCRYHPETRGEEASNSEPSEAEEQQNQATTGGRRRGKEKKGFLQYIVNIVFIEFLSFGRSSTIFR
jgi:hypothetical protein